MDIPADQLPPGWTNDPNRLRGLFDEDSVGDDLARLHGLTEFTLVLTNTPDTGEMGYILKSGKDYYWGDFMIDHICKITKPKTLPGILQTLATKGDEGLRMKELKPVQEIWNQMNREAAESAERAREELEREKERRDRGEGDPKQKMLFTPIG